MPTPKPPPPNVTAALASFATGGTVAVAELGLSQSRDNSGRWDTAVRHFSHDPAKALEAWLRRRWTRRAGHIGYVRVRVTTSIDHRNKTSVPLVIVETSGYGLDRLTASWSGHHTEPLEVWVDRVATAWAALSVRPAKAGA
jgi:hypothetical protein